MAPSRQLPRLVIADDHEMVVEGLASALSDSCQVVGKVTVLADLVSTIRESRPDVVILDVSFGGVSSVPTMRSALANGEVNCEFIIVTAFESASVQADAMASGAAAFLLKGASASDLRATITAIMTGVTPASNGASRPDHAGGSQRRAPRGPTVAVAGARLKRRHIEILLLLKDGWSRAQMASQLGLTVKGLDFHLHAARHVVGIDGVNMLRRWAQEHSDELKAVSKSDLCES